VLSSRRRHTTSKRDWSSDVCSSDLVDGFITLNQSIADFYREKYTDLPAAVLLPNAVERVAQTSYDGRLHEKAGLKPDQKILLFQIGRASCRDREGVRAETGAAMQRK